MSTRAVPQTLLWRETLQKLGSKQANPRHQVGFEEFRSRLWFQASRRNCTAADGDNQWYGLMHTSHVRGYRQQQGETGAGQRLEIFPIALPRFRTVMCTRNRNRSSTRTCNSSKEFLRRLKECLQLRLDTYASLQPLHITVMLHLMSRSSAMLRGRLYSRVPRETAIRDEARHYLRNMFNIAVSRE